MKETVDLTFRARAILETWFICQPETVVSFWGVLFDEEQYLWTAPDDADIELLVEQGFLRPSGAREPTPLLRQAARGIALELRSGRAWRVPERLREMLAA